MRVFKCVLSINYSKYFSNLSTEISANARISVIFLLFVDFESIVWACHYQQQCSIWYQLLINHTFLPPRYHHYKPRILQVLAKYILYSRFFPWSLLFKFSAVRDVTCCGLYGLGSNPRKARSFITSTPSVGPTQLPTKMVPAPSPGGGGVKQLEIGLGHPSAFSADVKNEWNYTYTPPPCMHGTLRGDLSHVLLTMAELMVTSCPKGNS
jgi:hypothetical protein